MPPAPFAPASFPPAAPHCLHCDAPLTSSGKHPWRWLRRALAATAAGAATITLMACYGGPSVYDDCVDLDDDGWFPGCYDEPCDPQEDPYCDCNDNNPNVHPGAPDPIGDGVDTDCSGDDGPAKCGDEACPDATYYPDAQPDAEPDAEEDAGPDASMDARPDAMAPQ